MSEVLDINPSKLKNTWKRTPTVFQMENTECGAASLAMILAYYKHHVSLEELRIDCGVSKDGCKLSNVTKAAEKHGLKFKAYTCDLKDLVKEEQPCIIHWNFDHLVVFEGVKKGYAYINDPAEGRRKINFEELSKSYTGIMVTFEKTDKLVVNSKPKSIMNFLKSRAKTQVNSLVMMLILGLVLVLPGMLTASFTKIFIDEILTPNNLNWFFTFIMIMLFTAIYQFAFSILRNIIVNKFQMKLSLLYGYKFINHMLKLPISFYEQRFAGDLSQRIMNNDSANSFLSGYFVNVILDIFTAIFYLIFMIIYSVPMTIISVVGLAISLYISIKLIDYIKDDTLKLSQDTGKLSGQLFSGIEISSTLKACGIEDRFVQKLLGHYSQIGRREQVIGRIGEISSFGPSMILQITNIVVLMIGATFVIDSQITLGMLAGFGVIFNSFVTPVNKVFGLFQQLQNLRANLLRVNDIENYERDKKFQKTQISEQEVDNKLSGKLEIKHLKFGYSAVAEPIFEDFNLSLNPGEVVALVGPSGCGKSSILKILSGLYEPWEGEILIDDKPMQSYPTNVLTTSISAISQDTMMVSGTTKENLTLWNDLTLDEDIIKAAKDACIHDDISKARKGYNYKLSQGAKNISGGQRQRLEIARALVSNPSILLMDEATSALDPIVENQVMENIKRRGCSCVIVAHRLTTIRDADKIICIDNGEIVQTGTHESLKDKPGMYKNLIKNL